MAEISKITLPSGTTYDIKDAVARATIGGAIAIVGTTTTELYDEATTNPITINGESYTAHANNAVFYGKKEFVFDGTKWHEFGDMTGLGDMAMADTASASYTPAGNVSAPTISVATAGSTGTIHNPTKVTVAKTIESAAPGETAPSNPITYYSVSNETLSLYQIGYTTGDSITTSDVTVKTGDAAYEATAPTFSGTAATITVTPDS